jgi:RND superfamily putative drug exporter
VIALPAAQLRLGEAGNAALPTSDTARRAYDAVSHAFGPGYNGQLAVVVTTDGVADPKAAAAGVAERIGAIPGIVTVSEPQFDQSGRTAVFTAVPATAPDAPQTADLVQAMRGQRAAVTDPSPASAATGEIREAVMDPPGP